MIAVILAAGVGSRLQPITYDKPKCLTKIGGISLLERQLKAFENNGFSEVFIVMGYRNDQINRHYLRNKYKYIKLNFVENHDFEITNNMYSLYILKEFIKGKSFILCNGDIIFEEQILTQMINSKISDLIAVDEGTYSQESMKVEVKDTVVDISKELERDKTYGCSIDIYKISVEGSYKLFDEIEQIIEKEKSVKEWTEVALQRLIKKNLLPVYPLNIHGLKWMEIDNLEDLQLADLKFSDLTINLEELVLFIDIDGTLFTGNEPIEGTKEFITFLETSDIPYYLLTNNSSYSKRSLSEKFEGMGIHISDSHIIQSTDGLLAHLKKNDIVNTFVLGTEAMKSVFEESSINPNSEIPQCVVLGYDTEITYNEIVKASKYLNQGLPFYATHCDTSCPTPEGPVPDIGSFIKMFEVSLNRSPDQIFGKPNKDMIDYKIIEHISEGKKQVVVIGDRLYTDMKMARNVNGHFVCVLSGETDRKSIEEADDFPDLIIHRASDLLGYWAK
ncbi:HAD-IIA family hydrolase [Paenibacillus sp. FSL K6-1566]|uniref:HAD-IIA family hydrolase n=1 Tax=Paenibacillus TaxID=44249 RepID=UPI00203F4DA3|nr:HAD-IIA family hydrolase [Paenibacillus lactis]MCM3493466.1 HAD-IIA family hydrolase [Paenibacillus lactis]